MRMRVVVSCEESGIVRDAFLWHGHDAVSVDLLPSRSPGPHIQGDIRDVDLAGVDLLIGFPPCTHLAVSGAKHFSRKRVDQFHAAVFFAWHLEQAVPKIAVENPIGVMSTWLRPPDQIFQPWMFGHPETKATCLWLKGLPVLQPTDNLGPPKPEQKKLWARVHRMPPGPDRARDRAATYAGVAWAMATQWGTL